MNCFRCGRPLKRISANGYGPKCSLAVFGIRPKREHPAPPKDDRTPDLFAREKEVATTVHALIGGVSLEMNS